jgi:hypothetical protein
MDVRISYHDYVISMLVGVFTFLGMLVPLLCFLAYWILGQQGMITLFTFFMPTFVCSAPIVLVGGSLGFVIFCGVLRFFQRCFSITQVQQNVSLVVVAALCASAVSAALIGLVYTLYSSHQEALLDAVSFQVGSGITAIVGARYFVYLITTIEQAVEVD